MRRYQLFPPPPRPCTCSLLLLMVFLTAQVAGFAQSRQQTEQKRDSLLRQLAVATDSNLAWTYISLASNISVSDSMAGVYADKSVVLADSIGYQDVYIKGNYVLGHLAFGKNQYRKALIFYRKGLKRAREVNNLHEIAQGAGYLPDTYFNLDELDSVYHYNALYREAAIVKGDSAQIGDSYLRDGGYYGHQNMSEKSIQATINAAEIFAAIKDTVSLADAYGNLGLTLSREGDAQEAEAYFLKSLNLLSHISNVFGEVVTMVNYGVLLKNEGRLDQGDSVMTAARARLEKAWANYKIGSYYYQAYKASVLINHAEIRLAQQRPQEAVDSLAILIRDKSDALERPVRAAAFLALARGYQALGAMEEARRMARNSLADFETSQQMEEARDVLSVLVPVEAELGNYEAAYTYQQKYQTFTDSLNSLERRKQYQSLLLDYEKEIDQRKIAELEQDSLEAANRRNLLLALLGLVGAMAVFLWLFFRARQKQQQILLDQERQLDEMKTRFFTQISHELRTPLTLILGPLEQLIEGQKNEKDKEKLVLMRRNANRLLELVNQVMDLSKLREGKLTLQAAPLDLVDWTRVIFSSFHSKAEIKEIQYTLEAPDEEVEVYVDKEKYQQVLSNLLANALKFTPQQGEVTVKVEKKPEGIAIAVQDNGPGLSPEELTHVFDAFYQASTASDKPFEAGTGIGLALCKELVELHGGSLSVESGVGQGSTFCILLPLGKAHLPSTFIQETVPALVSHTPAEKITVVPATNGHAPANQEQPLVLLAEDIPDMQEYLRSVLGGPYRLLVASDGQEAYELAQQHTPDLVIADIMMPRMDGMEFVRLLKDNDKTDHIPVIFLSAKSSMEDRLEGWRREAFAFLSKPFNPRELLLVVESALKMQQRLQARFQGAVILKPAEVALSSRESRFLSKLTDYLEAQLDNTELNIEALASEMALSRSQLNRKLKALTGKNPTLFVRDFRLQKARQLLASGFGNVSEVSDAVGISSPAYFSRIFTEAFGISPSEFQKQPQKG
ncbi:MAG: ATP-binding protein [Bacteroidota bacterium]